MILSFADSDRRRKLVKIFALIGLLGGCAVFALRVYDPRGMNIALIAFNRKLVVAVAGLAVIAALVMLITSLIKNNRILRVINIFALSLLILVSLIYLVPPVLQYTREFIYFGEAGISTNAMLRALGFTLGLCVCLLLVLSSCEVHKSLNTDNQRNIFLLLSVVIFALEFSASSVAALQRLKVIKLTNTVFQVMIWRGENPNAFLYSQLILALIMLVFVIRTHMKPSGEYANKALLRKEKARLRDCRRWSWSLFTFGLAAVLIVTVLHYYDTKPPAEVQPEPYEISQEGIISIELAKVSDGHLHKFSYVTPNKFDVRFLIVKKPAGTAYGVGLDACDICGPAGYYERGDEVVCRRCDVVMNKNTIGFKGGCNPVPFEYEVRLGKIFIDVKELEKHERRFK